MNILLHICCSNCALYPVKIFRSRGDKLTGFWFNPNIHPYDEYSLRLESLKRLAGLWKIDIQYLEDYDPMQYFRAFNSSNGFNVSSDFPPAPDRCRTCYKLRLERTARAAKERGFDAFSTTLLISPYQDFEGIIKTGEGLANKYNIMFHMEDFRPWFREAMNLAREMDLYRQKYCGCIFSREERYISKMKNKKSKLMK
jgi:predicted adenine nucleotide alpha hydrolase (AANH) superfamily ATPase